MTSDSDAKERKLQCLIPLTKGKFAEVDPEDFAELSRHNWEAQKSAHLWYAVRRVLRGAVRDKDGVFQGGKVYRIKMHREIANTLEGFVCHHKNGRSLDNRLENLENMYPLQHKTHHIVRKHQRKMAGAPTIQQNPLVK